MGRKQRVVAAASSGHPPPQTDIWHSGVEHPSRNNAVAFHQPNLAAAHPFQLPPPGGRGRGGIVGVGYDNPGIHGYPGPPMKNGYGDGRPPPAAGQAAGRHLSHQYRRPPNHRSRTPPGSSVFHHHENVNFGVHPRRRSHHHKDNIASEEEDFDNDGSLKYQPPHHQNSRMYGHGGVGGYGGDEKDEDMDQKIFGGDAARSLSSRKKHVAQSGKLRRGNGFSSDQRKYPNLVLSQNRSCTDVICMFGFIAFLGAWGTLAYFAQKFGDPKKLMYPVDSQNRICGTDNPEKNYNLSSKPYLYFFDLTKCVGYSTVFEGCPTPQVCVSKCPDYYFTSYFLSNEKLVMSAYRHENDIDFDEAIRNRVICTSEEYKRSIRTYQDLQDRIRKDECTLYVVSTKPVGGRCVPNLIMSLMDEANSTEEVNRLDRMAHKEGLDGPLPNSTALAGSKGFIDIMLKAKKYGELVLSDLAWSSWQIGILLIIAALISFIWILLMRWFSSIMVWISITVFFFLMATATGVSWVRYHALTENGEGRKFRLTLRYPIIVSIFLAIMVLIFLFLRKRIVIAIALIKASSRAVGDIKFTLAFPIIPFLLQLAAFGFWAYVALYLASWSEPNCRRYQTISTAGDIDYSNSPQRDVMNGSACNCDLIQTEQEPHCVFVNFTENENFIFGAQAFNLFGMFWILFFLDGLCEMTLAGAFASHYWSFKKPEDVPKYPLFRSLYRSVRYHLGSIAFGSLLLAIVRIIRVFLEYIDNKLKNTGNPMVRGFAKCFKCCLWCLEKVVKFLNKNAYIMIAMYGKCFMLSAKDAFSLLKDNIAQVWVLDKVADFLLFLGKLVVTAGMGAIAYVYFDNYFDIEWSKLLVDELNYSFLPMIVVTIGSYLICSCFFEVYEMAVDTTFLCFLVDKKNNDGTAEHPYFMSKKLMKLLNKKKKAKIIKKKKET